MDAYSVRISGPAKADVREIASYISQELQEPDIAERYVDLILEAIGSLEDMPARFAIVSDDELAREGVRALLVRNYRIFYRIDEPHQTVTIDRVLYQRRDWPNP